MRVFLKLIFFVLVFMGVSCGDSYGPGNDEGELVGVSSPVYEETGIPFGMTFIPPGSFVLGTSSFDMSMKVETTPKTVSMSAFFMDDAEITNNEYRQFVYWVRDNNIRIALGVKVQEMLDGGDGGEKEDGNAGILQYAFLERDTSSAYYKYMIDKYGTLNPNSPTGGRDINWNVPLEWDVDHYPDLEYTEILESFHVPVEQRIKGERILDISKYIYKYYTYDSKKLIENRDNLKDAVKENVVNVYPDTTVWIKDFSYSYNEPMHNDYFYHTAFSEYPVVGVNWNKAVAFCNWRTDYKNEHNEGKGLQKVSDFRLPSEFEWEYSARGGIDGGNYPWGGPYTMDDRGCILANFKPLRGDYLADGALYTVESKSFIPNAYGLYNMSGNVSEWTSTSYREDIYAYISSINPNYVDDKIKEKVIRGGSWKDFSYYLQVFVRDYEYMDTSRTYIGFRCVQDFKGSSANIL